MREVIPLEYTFVCQGCKKRYALGPSEYFAHEGLFFTCQCTTQTRLVDFDVITYQIRQSTTINNQKLIEYKTEELND